MASEGKLFVSKKGKLFVKITNARGKEEHLSVPDDAQPDAVRRVMANPDKAARRRALDGVSVLFERDGQQARIVSLRGQIRSGTASESLSRSAVQTSVSAVSQRPATATFHNPYNFVPAPPRNRRDADLGDRRPEGHHRLKPSRYPGRIRLRTTAVTPLLVVDAARAEEDADGHKTFDVRLDHTGRPYIAPTSIKGMLRAAFEAVTNSRFGVFFGHDRRLAYRAPAKVTAEPAIVESSPEGGLQLRILKAARLRFYDKRSNPTKDSTNKGRSDHVQKYGDGTIPKHGDRVWIKTDSRGRVTEMKRRSANDESPGEGWKKGWVLVNGPNINTKAYERVFYLDNGGEVLPIDDNARRLWEDLITNYQEIHQDDLEDRKRKGHSPSDYLGPKPGQTAWSRHIYRKEERKLTPGTLCYVERAGKTIKGLYPVTISRKLFPEPPESCLDPSLRPAGSLDQLSPADRVFGWVHQKGSGSYRGQLRISHVECRTDAPVETFKWPGVPLAILGQPKPQQTRFYLAKDKEGTPLDDGLRKDEILYRKGRYLRGRKVYPHHGGLPTDYWENPTEDRTQTLRNGRYEEYRMPSGDDERTNQNRSVLGWIKPGAQFEFDIDFWNLSAVEVGALLWLLSLPDGHYLRFGGGKPLGFGSVRLEIVPEGSVLADGEAWAERYRTLADDLSGPDDFAAVCDQLVSAFQDAVGRAYGDGAWEAVSFIKAFLQACRGFDDAPVHYPRLGDAHGNATPPNREGESFRWFVENERVEKGKPRYGHSLPSLEQRGGLPYLPARSPEKSRGPKKNKGGKSRKRKR